MRRSAARWSCRRLQKQPPGNTFGQLRTYSRTLVGRHGCRCPLLLSSRKKESPVGGERGFCQLPKRGSGGAYGSVQTNTDGLRRVHRGANRLPNLRVAKIWEFPRRGGVLNSEGKKPKTKPYTNPERLSDPPRLRPQVCGEALDRMVVVAFCAMGLSRIVGQAYNLLKE